MADSTLDPARRRGNKRINRKWARRMDRMAKPERCSKCGAMIALVGRAHRCLPYQKAIQQAVKAFKDKKNAARRKPTVEALKCKVAMVGKTRKKSR